MNIYVLVFNIVGNMQAVYYSVHTFIVVIYSDENKLIECSDSMGRCQVYRVNTDIYYVQLLIVVHENVMFVLCMITVRSALLFSSKLIEKTILLRLRVSGLRKIYYFRAIGRLLPIVIFAARTQFYEVSTISTLKNFIPMQLFAIFHTPKHSLRLYRELTFSPIQNRRTPTD